MNKKTFIKIILISHGFKIKELENKLSINEGGSFLSWYVKAEKGNLKINIKEAQFCEVVEELLTKTKELKVVKLTDEEIRKL